MNLNLKNNWLLFLLFSCSCFSQKKQINITILYKQNYCGGARPSTEMLAKTQEPQPYANKTIIIVSNKGKIDSVKTTSAGVIKKSLKIGSYKLFEAWRYYKNGINNLPKNYFDLSCLKAEWEKEIKEIYVTKKEAKVISKNEIIEVCPWKLNCILEAHRPPPNQ